MKRIGIIGGMSYESTLHYYEQINRQVNKRAGGLTSADLVLRSVNFAEYHQLMEAGAWDEIAHKLSFEALDLVMKNECDYIAIATNTMHKVADRVAGPHEVISGDNIWPPLVRKVAIPLVHIGDCVGEECKKSGARRVLLLGTKFTMAEKFMKEFLFKKYGIKVMAVSSRPEEVDEINRIIFEELCHGIVRPESKEFIINFITEFIYRFSVDSDFRPDAIVLGCTELNMLLKPSDVGLPLIDSTMAHINKLVDLCLSD
ncbi:amino acid racemase [Candidatus Saccharibacteria bacterium]|nr:amino acid racemase [Candidatus Saccharibacteria bacterium]